MDLFELYFCSKVTPSSPNHIILSTTNVYYWMIIEYFFSTLFVQKSIIVRIIFIICPTLFVTFVTLMYKQIDMRNVSFIRAVQLVSLSAVFSILTPLSILAEDKEMGQFIDNLMNKMTLEEKIGQLNLASGNTAAAILSGGESLVDEIKSGLIGATGGSSFEAIKKMQEASQQSRLKIPLLIGLDVIHGYHTVFPIPLALSCTWDVDLIEESARIAAREASAIGVNWTYSPMVDISRDPRWGRVSEGGGEDPWWGSQVATAMVRGYQGDDLKKSNTIMACVKHFALYGASEAGRDYNTVDMSRQQMLNDYLPPYRAAFDAGAGSAMSSFNLVDGIPATGNHWLMTDLLRRQWGWNGFVVTDFNAINEMVAHGIGDSLRVAELALKAGIDMDMQSEAFITYLKSSLDSGHITETDINQACRRVLEAKYKLGLFDDPYRYINEKRAVTELLTGEHLAFARKIAARSMILLKNENNLLPLKKEGKIAVVGPFANDRGNLLGAWVMKRDKSKMASVTEGIRAVGGNRVEVVTAKGANITDDPYLLASLNSPFAMYMGEAIEQESRTPRQLLDEALQVSADADVIVAVLGESAAMSGEASSRSDISIPESQQNLLRALTATGKPVVLLLLNGRPLTLPWESEHVPAILEAWAPGTASGYAIADVLFGDYNPSGRLTMTFPRSVGQIPLYYNYKNTGRPFHAQNKFTSKYLDVPNEPLYPFGYGLSYTTFDYGDVHLDKTELQGSQDMLMASVNVTNTGNCEGEEVVQLYITDPIARISRPVKELKGCQKIFLCPGETRKVTFSITVNDLKYYDTDGHYDWDGGEFFIQIGANSAAVKSAGCVWNR